MHNFWKVVTVLILIVFIVMLAVPAKSVTYFFKFNLSDTTFIDTYNKAFVLPHNPIFKDNKYIVPLRAVVEDAGGAVHYIADTKTILLKYGDNTGLVKLGNSFGTISKKKYLFAVKPFIIKGRTMISVNFVAKLLNGSVEVKNKQCKLFFYRIFTGYDVLNNKISIYSEPKRIVSLAPNLTEILFAIGAGNKVVGVSSYSNYPPEAKEKPKVGGFFNPSIERIFALNPNVVFVARGTPLTVVNKLRSLKVNVYTSDPHSIKDIYNLLLTVGKITGNVLESKRLVASMQKEEKEVINKAMGIPESKRKKVYVEIWNNPKMSAGKDTFINALIGEAGGINIAENAKGDWPVMNNESIIQANPDVIILLYDGNINEVKNRPGWKNISAVKNNKIFIENPDIFERPGPRIIQALKLLFNIVYGEAGG